MKKTIILIFSLLTIGNIFAQDIFDWKDTAPDANWKQGAAGNRWYDNTNHTDLSDEPGFGVLRFNNNHELNMTNNVSGTYSQHKILFESSNTSTRTLGGNPVRLYDYSGNDPKIENQSNASHIVNFNISGDGDAADPLELNPVHGDLTFGGTIDNMGGYVKVYGDNSKVITLNGVISGAGGFTIEENSTAIFNAANTYTGVTNITNGKLQYGIADAIDNASNLSLNGGTFSTGAATGYSDTLGTLILADDSTIDLGTGSHAITFSNSSGESWTAGKILTINGWGTGSEGQIYVGNDNTGLTAGQLDQIYFTGYSVGAYLMADGELVPVNNDTEVDDTGTQPGGAGVNYIASINDTAGEAENVFDFYITDSSSGDGLDTKVTNIRIKPYNPGTDNTADWTDNIGGIVLKNEGTGAVITTGTATITDTYIDIPITVNNLVISDNHMEEIGVYIYFNTSNIEDGEFLSFMVDADNHGFTADSSGSIFSNTFTNGDFHSNKFTINVEATELQLLQQPSNVDGNAVMTPAVKVAYTDENGNIDIDYTGDTDMDLEITATGSTFAGTTTLSVDAVDGIVTFSDIEFTVVADDVTITATDDGYLGENITSNPFIVGLVSEDCSQLFISEYGHYWDGSEGANYIEIYNSSTSSVVLDGNYQIYMDFSNNTTATIALSGTIAPGEVFVLSDDDGNVPAADQTSSSFNYSGDDTILLQWNGGSGAVFSNIDVIGDGTDPGTGFTVDGITDATNMNTIYRKKTVSKPNSDWASSATDEWIVSSYNQKSLSFHHSECNYYPCSATQETALLIDFDANDTGYTTSTPQQSDGDQRYFTKTDEASIDPVFTNEDGNFFAAQNTDDTPVNNETPDIYINNIDISGLQNLKFSILIAEDDSDDGNEDWDSNSYMHITYSIDDADPNNPAYDKNLLWVESTNSSHANYQPAVDVNFDGIGNLFFVITDTFQEFTKDIAEEGNLLHIRIALGYINHLDEDIAFDDIKITGDRIPVSTYESAAWDTAPAIGRKTIINDDYNTSSGNVSTCRCEIKSGKTLTVDAGHYLLVAGAIDNDGSIVVQHEGSLVQLDDHAVNTGSGTYQIHKTTPTYLDYDYTYWSSPIDNETIGSVFATNPSNRIFKFTTANFLDLYSGYGHPQTSGSPDSYDDNADDWQNVSGATVLQAGKGYIAMGEGSPFPLVLPPTGTQTQSVVFDGGKPNNGVITVPVTLDKYNQDNNDTPGTYSGADSFHTNLNLIGNPYASAIDIAALRTDPANAAILEGTFYLWTHDTQITSGGGPWAWNFTNDDYATITVDAGGVFSQVGAGNGSGSEASQFIASGQGFMANVTDNGEVTFNNSMRVAGENTHFLKATNTTQVDRIWVNLTQPETGLIRKTLIGFYDTATDDYQAGQDGQRMQNGQSADFYSLIPGDSRHFAIQNLATFTVNKKVSLGVKVTQTGIYEINLDKVAGLFETQAIYLNDLLTGLQYNLSNLEPYQFEVADGEVGEINDRFELVFISATASDQDAIIDQVTVFPNPSKNIFNINVPFDGQIEITIYDVTGKIVKQQNAKQINLTNYAKGIYFVKIKINGQQTIKKLLLN